MPVKQCNYQLHFDANSAKSKLLSSISIYNCVLINLATQRLKILFLNRNCHEKLQLYKECTPFIIFLNVSLLHKLSKTPFVHNGAVETKVFPFLFRSFGSV